MQIQENPSIFVLRVEDSECQFFILVFYYEIVFEVGGFVHSEVIEV